MKLATVEYEKTQQTALVTGSGEQLLLLERAHHDVTGKPAPELETMQTIIEGGPAAREILDRLADWYVRWVKDMQGSNPDAVYSGEQAGMLEVWADLYALTKKEKYLFLIKAYEENA
ncbi:MAG: hypothetical protein ABS976_17425, partial [Rhodococcus sp. (in: high G+C Gram-positive bacteria)]